jgi:hypothetical protein
VLCIVVVAEPVAAADASGCAPLLSQFLSPPPMPFFLGGLVLAVALAVLSAVQGPVFKLHRL